MTTAENDNDDSPPFDWSGPDWDDMLGDASDAIASDIMARAASEDPFATSYLADCVPSMGLTPSALTRFRRASAAYLAACNSGDYDDERQEILRLISAYWHKRSRAFWLD